MKQIILNWLKKMDAAFSTAQNDAQKREKNLDLFGKLSYDMLRKIVEEVVAVEPRLSCEERNKGFFIKFEGYILFRVSYNVFSERGEIIVNRERGMLFNGDFEPSQADYVLGGAVYDAVLLQITSALHNELSRHFHLKTKKL